MTMIYSAGDVPRKADWTTGNYIYWLAALWGYNGLDIIPPPPFLTER